MRFTRGSRAAAIAVAVLAAVPVSVAVGAGPAQAADTWQCASGAAGYAVDTAGSLWRYPFTAPGTATAAHGTRVEIGTGGWQQFGKVLGGPDGRVYGISSAGLFRYRWNGSTWDTVDGTAKWQISTNFTSYAAGVWRDQITVDEIGDFYLVDSNGRLRWYRFNETTRAWTIDGRVIDTGWNKYNLIFSAGPGVIYGRTPDGKLFRNRFEPSSQRWVQQHLQVGNGGWQNFKNIFGIGGDTLYGVRTANGELAHYRYREDTNTWPVQNRIAGNSGWQNFLNVGAVSSTCKLTDRHEPARPATPIQPGSPTAAIQRTPTGTALGAIEYVYADNIGRLRHAFQESPDNFGSIQWSTVPTDAAFTGRPALHVTPQGNVRLLAQSTISDAHSFVRNAAPSTAWAPGKNIGGALKSRPAVVKLSDGTPAVFGLDADGAVWFRKYDGTAGDLDLLGWKKLGGSGLTGELTIIAGVDRKATLFALDADGTPVTASYLDGVLSAWTELGGTGFTATPAAVKLPGQVLRVFGRDADGRVQTQQQNSAGVFPGTWTPVGDFVTAGAPAAILDPPTGRLGVFARGTDDEIYRVFETATGSGSWGDWTRLNQDAADPASTDPTITEYVGGSGESYFIVYRNANDATRVYTRGDLPGSSARAARSTTTPAFKAHQLPAPPK